MRVSKQEAWIHQAFVMGKMKEQLLFKLAPIASGDHSDSDDAQKVMQSCRHFSIEN